MNDLISRQAAIDAILHNQEVYSNNFGDDPIDKYTIAIIDNDAQTIAQLPYVQPEQKVGKWIRHENEDGEPYGHNCSVCGEWYVMPYGKTKFCPNCGAKMEEQDE